MKYHARLFSFRLLTLSTCVIGAVVTILGDLYNDDRAGEWWSIWRELWKDCPKIARY